MALSSFCYACFTTNDENRVGSYEVENESLRAIFRVNELKLCYLCKKVAQRTEVFIKNVQNNQVWLENFQNLQIPLSEALQTDVQIQPLVHLSYKPLSPVTVGCEDIDTESKEFLYNREEVSVKVELKEESLGDILDYDCTDLEPLVKKEDGYSFKLELTPEDLNKECVKKCVKKRKKCSKSKLLTRVKKHMPKEESKREKKYRDSGVEVIHLTIAECISEIENRAQDKEYLEMVYKCESCVKGFTFKGTYDKHMERHSKGNGSHSCKICGQRFESDTRLSNHMKNHTLRYRCKICGYTKLNRPAVKDHYTSQHRADLPPVLFECVHCSKKFKRQIQLCRHLLYAHGPKSRVQCYHCNKMYSNKAILKSHIIMKHPSEVSGGKLVKRHVCKECGKAYSAPSTLLAHMRCHSLRKDFYCVECDKSFKSAANLKTHLKTATPHCQYDELPLQCMECDKRFAIKRDVERHMNRVHLNIKPYQCDQCERTYLNSYNLKEHHRIAHEGYKRPMRFPCSMCDRVFDRSQILKSHLRTHTGERPYHCSECDATFGQSSALGTHFKLIHLKLTRDGRPKNHGILRQ